MSDALERKIDELEELIKVQNNKSVWSKFNIGTIITIVVLAVSVVGSWFTLRAEVSDIRGDVVKIEKVQDRHTDDINDVKLKSVQDSTNIKHIKEKVDEVDEKLDQLLGR